jgi:hypothetical protein
MPFLNRWPYRPELEFRFVYESRRQEREFLNVPILLSCVDRVYLSPLLPIGFYESVTKSLLAFEQCARIEITRSILIENER